MEHHDVILECAKFASLDTVERPREEVGHQGLPPSRKRYSLEYSCIGNFYSARHLLCNFRLAYVLSGFTVWPECV
jgi:hypothetical protein